MRGPVGVALGAAVDFPLAAAVGVTVGAGLGVGVAVGFGVGDAWAAAVGLPVARAVGAGLGFTKLSVTVNPPTVPSSMCSASFWIGATASAIVWRLWGAACGTMPLL